MILPVYNLQFRPHSKRLVIGDYTFERVTNYAEEQAKLQFLVNSHGLEFSTTEQTGGHAHTANVTGPDVEGPGVIPWQHENHTALEDIILLLKLFTGRDVFALKIPREHEDEPFAILADPRKFPWGGSLICSLPYEGEVVDRLRYEMIDNTLSVHLPKIYQRIRSPEWLIEFRGGYFLLLVCQAIQQRLLEAAFSQCWSVWEHLFASLNVHWMSERAIQNLEAREKIAFLLVRFGIRDELQANEKSRLVDLINIRNRLIHNGRFPERDSVRSDAMMFIRMTEFITAKALGLLPSGVFNTVEKLEEFLVNQQQPKP